MDYGLWLCRIQTEFNELDDRVNKEDWLIDRINEITKIYLNDLKNTKHSYDCVCDQLTKLINKGEK